MTLVDYYLADIEGLNSKDRVMTKRLWHRTAKRCLVMMSISSDPIQPMPSRRVPLDAHDKSPDAVTYPATFVPITSFFLRRSVDELVDLYRLTKAPGVEIQV